MNRGANTCSAWLGMVIQEQIPTLGICYGHQLLAHAWGGTVGNRAELGRTTATLQTANRHTQMTALKMNRIFIDCRVGTDHDASTAKGYCRTDKAGQTATPIPVCQRAHTLANIQTAMSKQRLTISYIGHATTLIDIDGVRLLTDPILRNRVLHLQRRPGTVPDFDLLSDLDGILISHLHWDHVDLPSLGRLDPATKLFVPEGSAGLFRRQGFKEIIELAAGQRAGIGSITIEAVFAQHEGGRIFSGIDANCLGFVVHGNQSVYFAGDTDLFPEMDDLCQELDVALLPVWGWGPTLGPGHLTPYRAALALRMLAPRIAVPIHWGTFHPIGLQLLRPTFLDAPPHTFARFAQQLAPNVDVQIVGPGQTLDIPFRY